MGQSSEQLIGESRGVAVTEVVPNFPRYSKTDLDCAIRQGEIISDVVEWLSDPTCDPPEVLAITHKYCVVVTQDCDLDQDYKTRQSNPPKLQNCIDQILLLIAFPTTGSLAELGANSDEKKRIRKNTQPKIQLLEKTPQSQEVCGEGVPELVVDLRRIISIKREELYRQVNDDKPSSARRRTRLVSPYRDHLQNRLSFHLGRVGLPEDHLSE